MIPDPIHTNAFSFENAHFSFDTFSPIIHTKTPENADENSEFRKRLQKWRRLKTYHFENVPFLVWTGENGDF